MFDVERILASFHSRKTTTALPALTDVEIQDGDIYRLDKTQDSVLGKCVIGNF